jgi:hypothetical protein
VPLLIMTHLSLCPYNLIVLFSYGRSEGEYNTTIISQAIYVAMI